VRGQGFCAGEAGGKERIMDGYRGQRRAVTGAGGLQVGCRGVALQVGKAASQLRAGIRAVARNKIEARGGPGDVAVVSLEPTQAGGVKINWIFSTGTSTEVMRKAVLWLTGGMSRGLPSMSTMVNAAKRTTGMFCFFIKEGWIRLPIEPRQEHRTRGIRQVKR
jgi:hypothetical protein